jgi:hypothetical protein
MQQYKVFFRTLTNIAVLSACGRTYGYTLDFDGSKRLAAHREPDQHGVAVL